MFVITADQINSRSQNDLAGTERSRLTTEYGSTLALPADRTAGDEIQALTADAWTCLCIVLDLTRTKRWSVGVGCGGIRTPLPSETREATGEAFFAAREAVTRAKKQPTRFALDATVLPASHGNVDDVLNASDVEALLNLLLLTRDRRTQAGWELYDLLRTGLTQVGSAALLGISAPSASDRARVAGLKAEEAALEPLTRLLKNLDRTSTRTDPAA
jgi:hypothetical protein